MNAKNSGCNINYHLYIEHYCTHIGPMAFNGKVVETYFIFKFMNDVFMASNEMTMVPSREEQRRDGCQSGVPN